MYEADIQCIIISLQRSSYILAKDFIVLRRCIFGKIDICSLRNQLFVCKTLRMFKKKPVGL